MSLLDSLPHLCTVQKTVATRGTAAGGTKLAASNVSTGVACWEQPASAREITEYDKRGMSVNRKVYFASDPGVEERHVILITSRDAGVTSIAAADQIALEVRAVSGPDASAGLGVLYKVMCEEVTNITP